jgi:hypothetical protein
MQHEQGKDMQHEQGKECLHTKRDLSYCVVYLAASGLLAVLVGRHGAKPRQQILGFTPQLIVVTY